MKMQATFIFNKLSNTLCYLPVKYPHEWPDGASAQCMHEGSLHY